MARLLPQPQPRAATAAARRPRRRAPPPPRRPPPLSALPSHPHALDIDRDDSAFGPRGVLLAGLAEEAAGKAQAWLGVMDPALPVARCAGTMLDAPTGALLSDDGGRFMAVETAAAADADDPASPRPPRVALLSGLAPAEAVALATHWAEYAGSPPPAVACLRPAMLPRRLGDVLLEAALAAASARDDASPAAPPVADAPARRAAIGAPLGGGGGAGAGGPIARGGGEPGGGGGAPAAPPTPPAPPRPATQQRPAPPARPKAKGFGGGRGGG